MFVSPPNAYVEALHPRVLIFGGGAFERSVGLDEELEWCLYDRISTLIRRGRKHRLYEYIAKWQLSENQEEDPHKETNLPAP